MGTVEAVEPRKRFGQRFQLTLLGRKLLSDLEEVLDKMATKDEATGTAPVSPGEQAIKANTETKQPLPSSTTFQPGKDDIYTAMQKLHRDKIDRYEKRRLELGYKD